MEYLAIRDGWGFQNDFATIPTKPTRLLHQAYTPASRINPRRQNFRTTSARAKVDIVPGMTRDLLANGAITTYGQKHRRAAATASPFAPMRADYPRPAFS
jgi:hypothetical protein